MKGLFDGDGRQKVEPVNVPAGTHPLPVSKRRANMLIERLEEGRSLIHSPAGALLWVAVTYCREQRLPYSLTQTIAEEGDCIGWKLTLQ